RARRAEPRRRGTGDGRRRGARQHRHRHRRRPAGDGTRLPHGGRSRPRRVPGWPRRLAPRRVGVVAAHRLPRVSVGATAVELTSRPASAAPGTAAADVNATDIAGLRRLVDSARPVDVDRALARAGRALGRQQRLEDMAALLSPPASERLEDLAAAAHALTLRRFGRTVHLFAPLYLSNECVSVCSYCGFSAGNEIARRTLDVREVEAEARCLVDRGFRHVLLVAGEHARIVSKDYLLRCVQAIAPVVPALSVEVQVWDTATYRRLVDAGCDGLIVYQEAYDRQTYAAVHRKGKKRNYEWRLAAPDRGAEAGMRRLGIGALLGLHPDWRSEAVCLVAHAQALLRRWWRAEVAVSLPRLRPAAGGYTPAV